jgi:hypothetical protein
VDIPPRYFTSERGYVASVVFYLIVMELIYFGPAIGVPYAVHNGGVDLIGGSLSENAVKQLSALTTPVAFPIVWALLLVGALRYVPWINNIEPALRRLAHTWAEIPHYVHELSRTLYGVEMKVDVAFPEGYRDDLRLVAARDFNAPPASEEHAWARLSYLMRELEEMNTELGNLPVVHFGARFADEYENAAAEFRSLTYRMARHVDERNGVAGAGLLGPDHRFKVDLRRAFARVALLLVVLLNLRYRSEEQISARLQTLGFNIARDPRRAEAGPDAAVTVLALAVILFFVCPAAVAIVDYGMLQFIGTGESARYSNVVYPAVIMQLNNPESTLFGRVMVFFLLCFISLLVMALVNLTIARRISGIDPREMFHNDWLHRPYGKYMLASAVSALLCLGTSTLMTWGFLQSEDLRTQMPIDRIDPSMLIWLGAMFFIALPLHVFAQNKGHSLAQVMGEGLIGGLVWAAVCFPASYFYFSALGTMHGQPLSNEEALGMAIYLSSFGFLIGTPFMAALLFVSKSARAITERQRATPLVVVEGGKAAA